MIWIIQNNLFAEEGYEKLVETLQRGGVPYAQVKIVPFAHTLEPEPVIPAGEKVFVCGAVTLGKIATDRGWFPGTFLNDNHRFEVWLEHYGTELLNHDAVVCRFGDAAHFVNASRFFMRPCEDNKKFNGRVYSADEYQQWSRRIAKDGDAFKLVDPDTMVVVGAVKPIQQEYRFFVVDGRIVTGSRYKVGKTVSPSPDIPDNVLTYAQSMVDRWQPARGFVIDIFVSGDRPWVGEINCLNAAGFYAADVSKLVQAIEAMEF